MALRERKTRKLPHHNLDDGEPNIEGPWESFENDKDEFRYLMSEIPKASRCHLRRLYPYVDLDTLPDYWSSKEKAQHIHVNDNSLGVLYRGQGKDHKDAASIRTTKPIPEKCLLYYFEVEIISKGRNGYMGIGLSAKEVNLSRLPGWDAKSYGYHGDDGHSFDSSGTGQPYGPTFTTGDIIGCGVNFFDRTCFYTKNGHNLGVAFTGLTQVPLYPTVGLQTSGEEVEANFGASPFIYDIDQDLIELRKRVSETIKEFPVNHADWQPMLHNFVKSWLVHNGYCATAQKFTAATQQTLGESVKSIKQRYKIQQCILNGKMSEAISLTMKNYPFVFEQNQNLLFVMKCRHFMEFVHGNDGMILSSGIGDKIDDKRDSASQRDGSSSSTTASTSSVPESGNKKRGRASKRLSNQSISEEQNPQNIPQEESSQKCQSEESENGSVKNGNSVGKQGTETMSDEEVLTIMKLGRELNKFWTEMKATVSDEESKRQMEMLREAFKVIANDDMRNCEMSDFYWLKRESIAQLVNNEIVRLMKQVEDNNPSYIVPLEMIIKQTKLCVELNNQIGAWLLDGL